jgi:4'-phosphopantetheinyl transferase EntD
MTRFDGCTPVEFVSLNIVRGIPSTIHRGSSNGGFIHRKVNSSWVDSSQGRSIARSIQFELINRESIHRRVDSSQGRFIAGRFIAGSILRIVMSTENLIES